MQIQALIAREVGGEAAVTISRPNLGSNIKVAKSQTFNGEIEKI